MAMPQRDDPPSRCALRRAGTIEAIKRLEPPSRVRYGGPGALLEYAVMHNDEAEAARLRAALTTPWGQTHEATAIMACGMVSDCTQPESLRLVAANPTRLLVE